MFNKNNNDSALWNEKDHDSSSKICDTTQEGKLALLLFSRLFFLHPPFPSTFSIVKMYVLNR